MKGHVKNIPYTHVYSSAEKAYCAMPARFPNIHPSMMDHRWYLLAMQQIVLGCWQQFIDLCDGHCDKCTCLMNSSGDVHWIRTQAEWECIDRKYGFISELEKGASKSERKAKECRGTGPTTQTVRSW